MHASPLLEREEFVTLITDIAISRNKYCDMLYVKAALADNPEAITDLIVLVLTTTTGCQFGSALNSELFMTSSLLKLPHLEEALQ